MKEYGLDALAEKGAFLCWPSPIRGKAAGAKGTRKTWTISPAALWPCRRAREKVGGFIGMIFYIGGSPSAGALLLAMSARRPLNVAGVLLSELPADYSIPQDGVNAPQVAYLCGGAARAADYFGKVNGVTGADARPLEHAVLYTSPVNPNVRHIVSELPFSAQGSGPCMGHAVLQKRGAGPTTPMGHIKSARILRPAALWHTSTTRASA